MRCLIQRVKVGALNVGVALFCLTLGCSNGSTNGPADPPDRTESNAATDVSRGDSSASQPADGSDARSDQSTDPLSSVTRASTDASTSTHADDATHPDGPDVSNTSVPNGSAAHSSALDPSSAMPVTSEGSSSGATGPGPVVGPTETAMTVEEFCAAKVGLQQPWCDYRDRCCTAEDVASSRFRLPGCQYMAEETADCIAGIEQDVSEDGLTFDGHWAKACLDALEPYELVPPTDCKGLLYDWANESNHDAPRMWALQPCQQMLTANVGEGEICNNVRACAPGLGCGPNSGVDEEFRCHARSGTNVSCYSDNECQMGLVCRPLDNGRCLPPSPTGGDCDVPEHCEDGNICHLDYCGPTLQVGDDCPNALFCMASIQCNFLDLTCAALLPAGSGPCDNDLDCAGRCDLATGNCVEFCGGTR